MRYALTYASDPDAYDWGDTDTIIFEYPTTLPDDLTELVRQVVVDYTSAEDDTKAREIAKKGWWFIRNVNDVDVVFDHELPAKP